MDATASLILAFCVCFNIPLSWKKLCLGPQVVWIGWCVNVRAGCFSIPRSKRLKLHLHVQKLLADPKDVHKRDLHKVAGLIQWVLGAFPLLRPWVGVLYKDIHCPPATNHSLDPHYFKEVFDCIDDHMRFIRAPTGAAIPVGAKLLEVRHLPIRQKKDLLKVVLSKRVWLRVAAKTLRQQCCFPSVLAALVQTSDATPAFAISGQNYHGSSSGRHGLRNQICNRWFCQTFDGHDLVQRMLPAGGFCFCRD